MLRARRSKNNDDAVEYATKLVESRMRDMQARQEEEREHIKKGEGSMGSYLPTVGVQV